MVTKLWDSPEIYGIDVPLPNNPLRNLNAYVIRTPERSLVVDTGFNRPECRDALWAGIRKLELDHAKTALFLTHFHSDHIGLVRDFVEQGIPVYMGRVEHGYYEMLQSDGLREMGERFLEEGFPREQLARQNSENQGRRYATRPGFPVKEVEDGARLDLGGVEIQAIHTPGHTPGHMVLYLPEQEFLFSGDHILFDITPNISIWPKVADPLADYITSLQKIRRRPVRAAFPAHRAAGPDTRRRIDQIIEHHGQRLDEIYQAVAARPGSTAYEVGSHIRWSARGLAWEQFPPHQQWFAMAETLAHLYHLTAKGQLLRLQEDGAVRYIIRAISPPDRQG